jgi:hypothetical protein
MTEISASEKKRIIAAIKRRKPSDVLRMRPSIQRPPLPARDRQFVQGFTQLMEKAGVDVDKINETLKRKQQEQPRPAQPPSRIDKKALAAAKRAFRHGIEERRRSAKRLAALDAQPASIFLDAPIFIDDVFESNIEPWNSTINFPLFLNQDNNADTPINFHFVWRNDSPHDVLVSAASLLIAKGFADCVAFANFGLADANLTCWVNMNIFELWNDPPTSPLVENTQSVGLVGVYASARSFFIEGADLEEIPPVEFFQHIYLLHNNFFTVPAFQAVEFQVGVDIFTDVYTFLDASASVGFYVISNGGFLMCPYVELQVLPVQQVLVPSSKRARQRRTRAPLS